MGIAGHIGIAFDSQDESLAIASFTGEGEAPEGDDWVKYQTEFGLVREDWWEMHRTFVQLALQDTAMAPLANLLIGQRSIGEGPGTDFFLFKADEVRAIALALADISGETIDRAILAAFEHDDFKSWVADHPETVENFRECLPQTVGQIAQDMAAVSKGGWAMIGAMV